MKTCPECEGIGVVDEGTDDEHQCPNCGGSGSVPDDESSDEPRCGEDVIWRVHARAPTPSI
jgi:predicted RNA-binding Zn-ribbon protein involved in translation (DUF1610 family)